MLARSGIVIVDLPDAAYIVPAQAPERVGAGQLPVPAGGDADLHLHHPALVLGGRGAAHAHLLRHPEGLRFLDSDILASYAVDSTHCIMHMSGIALDRH